MVTGTKTKRKTTVVSHRRQLRYKCHTCMQVVPTNRLQIQRRQRRRTAYRCTICRSYWHNRRSCPRREEILSPVPQRKEVLSPVRKPNFPYVDRSNPPQPEFFAGAKKKGSFRGWGFYPQPPIPTVLDQIISNSQDYLKKLGDELGEV